jgi:hypothetical protein
MATRGLKAEIKDRLADRGDRPRSMKQLIDLVIRIDTRLYERAQERKNKKDTPSSNKFKQTVQRTTYEARSSTNVNNNRPCTTTVSNKTYERGAFPVKNVRVQDTQAPMFRKLTTLRNNNDER